MPENVEHPILKGIGSFVEGAAASLPTMADPYGQSQGLVPQYSAKGKAEEKKEETARVEQLPSGERIPYKAGKITGEIGQGIAASALVPGSGFGAAALQGVTGALPQAVESASVGEPIKGATQIATGAVLGPATKLAGEAAKRAAKWGFGFALKAPKWIRERGINYGTIWKHKIGGTNKQILDQSEKKIAEYAGKVRSHLDEVKQNAFDMEDIFKKAEEKIVKEAKGTRFAGMIGELKKDIQEYRKHASDMIETYKETAKLYGNDIKNVTIDFLNDFRKSIGPKTGPIDQRTASISKKASNSLYGHIRETIDNALGDEAKKAGIKAANKELEDLIKVHSATKFRMAGNPAGILPFILGGTAAGTLGAASGGKTMEERAGRFIAGAALASSARSTVPASILGAAGRELSDRAITKILSGYFGSKVIKGMSLDEKMKLFNKLGEIGDDQSEQPEQP